MLLVDIKDQVALVTLNRPDAMNALSRALRGELHETMKHQDAIEMLIVRRDTAALPGLWDRYVELSGYLTDAGIP